MLSYLGPALTGFGTGFSLILPIGAQNTFVLRQGLLKQHVVLLCLFCALSDAILICAGVAGFGVIVKRLPLVPFVMTLAGAAFLLVYGGLRFRAAYIGNYAMELAGQSRSLGAVIAIAAAFTWANPHVYLDTLGLIGAISTSYIEWDQRVMFAIGATSASFVFFFGLGFGARLLAPIMQKSVSWRILDVIVGATMWTICFFLLNGLNAL